MWTRWAVGSSNGHVLSRGQGNSGWKPVWIGAAQLPGRWRDSEEAWLTELRSRKKERKNDLSKPLIGYGHVGRSHREDWGRDITEAAAVSCDSFNSSLPEDSGRRTSRVKGETKWQHRGYPDESLEGKFHESRNFKNHCTPRSWLCNRHFIKIQGCSVSVQMSLTFAQCS